MQEKKVPGGDFSSIDARMNEADLSSGITPTEYDNIYEATLCFTYRAQFYGSEKRSSVYLRDVTGRELVYLCSLQGRELQNQLNRYPTVNLGGYGPRNVFGWRVLRIVGVEKKLMAYSSRK